MPTKISSIYTLITADDKPLKRGLIKARKEAVKGAAKIQSALNKINFRAIGLAAAAMGGVIAVAMKKSIDAASDLEEATSKFGVVFGEQAAKVDKWVKILVDDYAMSTREARQFLSEIQDLLVPLGLNAEAAANMSNEVVKLAADLGSFNNLRTEDVMRDIQSALVGNFETMKKYGVVLNQNVVTQRALRDGLIDNKKELTATIKAQAAWNLILDSTRAAQGDMIRTGAGYANQMKRLRANIENTAAALGQAFLPKAAEMVGALNSWITTNQQLISQDIPNFILKIGNAVGTVITTIQKLDKTFDVVFGGKATKSIKETYLDQLKITELRLKNQIKTLERIGSVGSESYKKLEKQLDLVQAKIKLVTEEVNKSLRSEFFPAKTEGVSMAGSNENIKSTNELIEKQVKSTKIQTQSTIELSQALEHLNQRQIERAGIWDEEFRHAEAVAEQYKQLPAEIESYGDTVEKETSAIQTAWDSTTYSMEDSLSRFVTTGKFKFSDLISSMLSDLARLASSQFIGFLGGAFGGLFGGSSPYLHPRGGQGGGYGFQHGGHIGENVKGIGLKSGKSYEFDPNETVVPDKNLGAGVQIQINNYSSLNATVEEREDVGGTRRFLVEIGNDILRGGPQAKAIEMRYGLRPVGKVV